MTLKPNKLPETKRKTHQGEWKSTACILCTLNCGIKVQLSEDGQSIVRTKGDENHPASRGYVCNKASRLDYYQNRSDRLLTPMRRNQSGGYDAIDWQTAVQEIAAKMTTIRDTHGGDKIFYYGGGGQGNHLPGAYSNATQAALGVKYRSNAIAQEKTGEFWVATRMFGRWPHGDFEHAQVTIFLGKNPWQAHGIQRARITLREIAKDPERTMIVIDPKCTETANLADIHLAVKPARDAWLLAGMIATIVQEELVDNNWLEQNAHGLSAVIDTFIKTEISDCAEKSGIEEHILRSTARLIANAESVAVLEDLGVQMNRHSTLVSYLQRLLWVLTGNFAKPGTHYTVNGLGSLGTGNETGVSPVVGARIISGLVPCNVIAEEVLANHPDHYRAMIIESANPVHSLADSMQWREAMRALECSVVIDVAMTETARQADYVLPATSQYEKAEATFFNFEFPDNYFHIRKPIFKAPEGPLDEGEIHMRLLQAMDIVPEGIEEELKDILSTTGRTGFRQAVLTKLAENPSLGRFAAVLLYRTLGPALPDGMQNAAALWAVCHQYAKTNDGQIQALGLSGESDALGDALFDHLLAANSGAVVSTETWPDVWTRVPGHKVELALPELLLDAANLNFEQPEETSTEFPFLLSAGERRAFTANTIIRNPDWRRKDRDGALYINPKDAARLNLGEGSTARVSTDTGSLEVSVELNDCMQRGHISLPNGAGLDYPDENGALHQAGVSPNELTSASLRDAYVGTPWHKSVPAQLEAID